jgi:surfactin synthase thioesterase subunit
VTLVELVCFHHAGGGSASFHPLRRTLAALGADVALTTVKLPGWESRRHEPRYVDADACVRALVDELEGLLNRPHLLLGHRMGALLAYSLALQRIWRGLCAPEVVIVAPYRASHLPGPLHDLLLVDDHELAAELASYGGAPAQIQSRPERLELLLPTVRDDLRICQSYRPSGERHCRVRSRNGPSLRRRPLLVPSAGPAIGNPGRTRRRGRGTGKELLR